MNMSAEFNLVGGGQNPRFFVHFKPQFGDFTLKKTQSSVFKTASGGFAAEDGSTMVDWVENGKKFVVSPFASPTVKGVLSDVEVSARSAVPLRKNAVLNFRWGIRFPATDAAVLKRIHSHTARVSFDRFPLLMMNKVGIEHVAHEDGQDSSKAAADRRDGDVAAACLGVKRQLEIIQAENGMLRKAMDELKSEFFAVRFAGGGDKNKGELNDNFGGKAMEDEMMGIDELKKKNNSKGFKGTSAV